MSFFFLNSFILRNSLGTQPYIYIYLYPLSPKLPSPGGFWAGVMWLEGILFYLKKKNFFFFSFSFFLRWFERSCKLKIFGKKKFDTVANPMLNSEPYLTQHLITIVHTFHLEKFSFIRQQVPLCHNSCFLNIWLLTPPLHDSKVRGPRPQSSECFCSFLIFKL